MAQNVRWVAAVSLMLLSGAPGWSNEHYPEPQIIVSGVIYESGDIAIDSTFASLSFHEEDPSGPYEAALLNRLGEKLSTFRFSGSRERLAGDRSGINFNIAMDRHEGAHTLRISKRGAELKKISISDEVPEVSGVNLKARARGIYTLNTDIVDMDSDSCETRVAYSANGRNRWRQVAEFSGTGRSTVAFGTSGLPGSAEGVIRLYVSDGTNCRIVERVIAIPDKPPVIEVERRMRGTLANGNAYTVYEAIVHDLEDGRVGEDQIVWRMKESNDVIATGRQLSTTIAPADIKVFATDSKGHQAETSLTR